MTLRRSLALFDLDGTLVDRRAAFAAWAEEFVDQHRLGGGALALLLAADARHAGPMDSFFANVCQTFDLAEPPGQLWSQYRRRMPELASCHAGDLDALRRLRRAGWRIGIVTNGMLDNQLGKIRNTGLSELVDGWCISGGWMIGDSLDLDVAGGHAAGLRTIWLRQTGCREDRPAPDCTVDSVAEAVRVLIGESPLKDSGSAST